MAELTPMMKQYFSIKEKCEDKNTILFFRLGDFYEMFYDDAIVASKVLEITLTGKDCGQEKRAPMCGVPFHSADGYISKLVSKGYNVAICEQTEDPSTSKGIVKRDIVRIITPGTLTDSKVLDDKKNNYLCSVYKDNNGIGLSFVDVTTGEFDACEFNDESASVSVINELSKYNPSEIIMNGEAYSDRFIKEQLELKFNSLCNLYHEWCFGEEITKNKVREQFEAQSLTDLFKTQDYIHTVKSMGALLLFLNETQKIALSHIRRLNFYKKEQYMDVDISTRRNLELCETMRAKDRKGSLLWVLDKTETAMGARLLRKWLEQPLINCLTIKKRQEAVKELFDNTIARKELIESLKGVYDIERLICRIVYKNANGRDLLALKKSIYNLPVIKKTLEGMNSEILSEVYKTFDDLSDIGNLIERAIDEEAPVTIKEGKVIKRGFSEKADEYDYALTNGQKWIASLEQEEKERTGISKLKIGYNRVFGYYIEVTNSQKDLIPNDYIRKQTLANCERFINEKLKEVETVILTAREKIIQLEYDLFCQVRETIANEIERMQFVANQIAVIDTLCSLAETAKVNNYIMPEVNNSDRLIIKDGRHPVVEKVLKNDMFVPNNTELNGTDNMAALITGPNMAGKSTYMRQVALITIMAQIGSFVPASYAEIGICDKVFTRVGASDDLASGQSTFMVEMNEVSAILKGATKKSLLVLDEIGRGTSTYDGLSIARAVIEYIVTNKNIGSRTLFATHYHELTELENIFGSVKNYSTAVKKCGDDITFLRKIVRGPADGSFGIEVAKLSGIPIDIIKRAKEIQLSFEEGENTPVVAAPLSYRSSPENNINSFSSEVLNEIMDVDLSTLTPIEALNLLYKLQKSVND